MRRDRIHVHFRSDVSLHRARSRAAWQAAGAAVRGARGAWRQAHRQSSRALETTGTAHLEPARYGDTGQAAIVDATYKVRLPDLDDRERARRVARRGEHHHDASRGDRKRGCRAGCAGCAGVAAMRGIAGVAALHDRKAVGGRDLREEGSSRSTGTRSTTGGRWRRRGARCCRTGVRKCGWRARRSAPRASRGGRATTPRR